MKNTISLPISAKTKIFLSVGDKIVANKPFAEIKTDSQYSIPLAKLLKVDSKKISQYLLKSIGASVSQGDIIAKKRNFLSFDYIRVPREGVIKELNLTEGMVIMTAMVSEEKNKITIPVDGRIQSIDKHQIIIEIYNLIYTTTQEDGSEAVGKLYYSGDELSIFDIGEKVADGIILCKSITEETLIKLEVIGAAGILSIKAVSEKVLPWLKIGNDAFHELKKHIGEKVWLRPTAGQIILIK